MIVKIAKRYAMGCALAGALLVAGMVEPSAVRAGEAQASIATTPYEMCIADLVSHCRETTTPGPVRNACIADARAYCESTYGTP
jgi:hypothetical protein